MKQTLRIMMVLAMVTTVLIGGLASPVAAGHQPGCDASGDTPPKCDHNDNDDGEGDSAGDTSAEVDQKIKQDATAKSFQYQKVEQSNTNKGDVTQDERGPGSNNFIQSNYNEQSATNTASNDADQDATVSQG